MNVDTTWLKIGQNYTIKSLAEAWQYKDSHAISRGIVTPSGTNLILFFITEKSVTENQYDDRIDGNILYMQGEEKHIADKRIVSNLQDAKDVFHLFFRKVHATPYTYMGTCTLLNAEIKSGTPSEFIFSLDSRPIDTYDESDVLDYLLNKHNNEIPVGQIMEGASKVVKHVIYERNPANRKAAIQIHGTHCAICGFDYNSVYGSDLADSYIEIHHIKPISEGQQKVNPESDLIPVCANCHRMLHRRKTGNISIAELKGRLYHNDSSSI